MLKPEQRSHGKKQTLSTPTQLGIVRVMDSWKSHEILANTKNNQYSQRLGFPWNFRFVPKVVEKSRNFEEKLFMTSLLCGILAPPPRIFSPVSRHCGLGPGHDTGPGAGVTTLWSWGRGHDTVVLGPGSRHWSWGRGHDTVSWGRGHDTGPGAGVTTLVLGPGSRHCGPGAGVTTC